MTPDRVKMALGTVLKFHLAFGLCLLSDKTYLSLKIRNMIYQQIFIFA